MAGLSHYILNDNNDGHESALELKVFRMTRVIMLIISS